ncbi:apoptosis facilitator Bcl-2-like protein 14 [Gastrophryne carolinensis]
MEEISLREEEESMEYRMLMVYAQRTLPKYAQMEKAQCGNGADTSNLKEGQAAAKSALLQKEPKKKKKKNPFKRLIPKCVKPVHDGKEHPYDQNNGESPEEERAQSIARRMQRIIQRIKKQEKESGFRMRRASSVQVDGEDEDELIANIVQILRFAGDELNDQITQHRSLLERIQGLWSYSFFSKVADHFLEDSVPGSGEEQEQQINRIALCVHATTALTQLDNHPMNRLLGFGARYIKDNYSPWINSHGGWLVIQQQ